MTNFKKVLSEAELNKMLPVALKNVGVMQVFVDPQIPLVKAEFEVDKRNTQPFGVLHGGVSCLIAETLGSLAGYLMLEDEKQVVVGQSLTASHIRAAKMGEALKVSCEPVHVGRRSQIWLTTIRNEVSRLVSQVQLTLAVVDKKAN